LAARGVVRDGNICLYYFARAHGNYYYMEVVYQEFLSKSSREHEFKYDIFDTL
jgi:hypothetical protein